MKLHIYDYMSPNIQSQTLMAPSISHHLPSMSRDPSFLASMFRSIISICHKKPAAFQIHFSHHTCVCLSKNSKSLFCRGHTTYIASCTAGDANASSSNICNELTATFRPVIYSLALAIRSGDILDGSPETLCSSVAFANPFICLTDGLSTY